MQTAEQNPSLADSLNLSRFHCFKTNSPKIQKKMMNQAEAKFIVPDWGDKVNSGFAGGYDNPI
jgi:hypothetical protein